MVKHTRHGSQQSAKEPTSRYNWIFSKILIASIFEKHTKKRLILITQFKTEFLLPFTGSRKGLEKMPDLVLYLSTNITKE